MRKGKFQRASSRLQRALLFSFPFLFWCTTGLGQAIPQDLDEYFRRARELEQHEDYAGAEKLYLDAAKSYPHQPEILKRLGIVYQTELKFHESINAWFSMSPERSGSAFDIWLRLSRNMLAARSAAQGMVDACTPPLVI